MNDQKKLIDQLLNHYQAWEYDGMAACYHEAATFSDIAFRLNTRKEIHAMWHMICEKKEIKVEVLEVEQSEDEVHARIVDTYCLSETGRKIVNPIKCRFQFRDGLIVEHVDTCDPLDWARQAFGGLKGEIVGRVGPLRRMAARSKIRKFIASHPEYA